MRFLELITGKLDIAAAAWYNEVNQSGGNTMIVGFVMFLVFCLVVIPLVIILWGCAIDIFSNGL